MLIFAKRSFSTECYVYGLLVSAVSVLFAPPQLQWVGSPGLRTVPPEQRESTQGRRAAARCPGQTLQPHRSRPGLSLTQIYLHTHKRLPHKQVFYLQDPCLERLSPVTPTAD